MLCIRKDTAYKVVDALCLKHCLKARLDLKLNRTRTKKATSRKIKLFPYMKMVLLYLFAINSSAQKCCSCSVLQSRHVKGMIEIEAGNETELILRICTVLTEIYSKFQSTLLSFINARYVLNVKKDIEIIISKKRCLQF